MKIGIAISGLIAAALVALIVLWFTPLGTAPLTALFPTGPVATIDFSQVTIGRGGHASLVCPNAQLCPDRHDGTSVYDADMNKMKAAWTAAMKSEPRSRLVHSDEPVHQYTYMIRSVMWRMPDLITVQFVDQSDRRLLLGRDADRTTLAVYSRSLYGVIDFDTNSARVRRLLGFLDSHLDTYKR